MVVAADPLDDFLAGAGSGTVLGERLETIGLLMSLPGIVIGVGLVAFLLYVHKRASGGERLTLLRAVAMCGVLAAVGGLVETVGTTAVGGGTWIEDLTNGIESPLIRLGAGVLMTIGFLGSAQTASDPGRLSRRQFLGVIGVVVGAFSFATDGHTVSRGDVLLNASLDVVHVLAAGVWVGGIAGLVLLRMRRRRGLEDRSLAPTIVRFSTVASLAIVSVAAAGLGMSFLIVESFSDYWMTSWGRLLLVKLALVAAAACLGAYNHYVVVPALEVDPTDAVVLSRARGTIGAEAVIFLAVILVTVFLTGASIDQ